ncbi:unnamed protein product [Bursaphelenchus xylophilus]|uniref:(pine wood nematode) hypothetical protein n=1 Tax=Bursaphelenchus xylophilus TaxID=6326 RepID=A0A7I8X538_BURXY|nr:unnamed protein product [Bursaphelenchus xylophilus]CAG9129235.1 unnamed protein product [Bursaphelenchus xylophilus]
MKAASTVTVIDTTNKIGVMNGYYTTVTAVMAFLLVVYYGGKTWMALTKDPEKMTAKTKKLNRDMSAILVLQAILPPLFLYLPITLFHINVVPEAFYPFLGLSSSFGVSVVPLLDALVVLLILPAFRQTIFKIFRVAENLQAVPSLTPVISFNHQNKLRMSTH